MMIFVILGSQKNQFNRLLKALDDQIAQGLIEDEVFAQTGYSGYEPSNYAFSHFLDKDVFEEKEKQASLVITHGGTGAIMGALKKGKRVIAVPRKFELGEHNDDHQIQVVSELSEAGLITCCEDTQLLFKVIDEVKETKYELYRNAYHSSTDQYIEELENFINSLK